MRFLHIADLNAINAVLQVVWTAWKGAMVVGESGANDVLLPLILYIHAVRTANFQSSKSDMFHVPNPVIKGYTNSIQI